MEETSNSSGSHQVSTGDATASSSLDTTSSPSPTTTLPDAIKSLPNDILAEIRLWLYTIENPWTDVRGERNLCRTRKNGTFALVCRRFRAVELSVPPLWTTVRDQMALEGVKLNVERSGKCGLFVRVFADAGIDRYRSPPGARCRCKMWRLIAGEAERWEGLEVVVCGKSALYRHDGDNNDAHAPTNTCFSGFRGLVLPRLRWLVVKSEDTAAVDIVKSWTLPQLHDFRCDPPDVLFHLQLTHPLEALFLNMTPTDSSPFPWMDSSFQRYVATAPGADDLLGLLASPVGLDLQSLRLILGGYSLREPRTDKPIYPTLSSLKFLEIHFFQSTEVQVPIDWLFERILAPALDTVAIKFTDANGSPDVLVRWLELLDYRMVRVVRCEVACSWEGEEKEEFRERLVEAATRSVERNAASTPLLDIQFTSCSSYRFC